MEGRSGDHIITWKTTNDCTGRSGDQAFKSFHVAQLVDTGLPRSSRRSFAVFLTLSPVISLSPGSRHLRDPQLVASVGRIHDPTPKSS